MRLFNSELLAGRTAFISGGTSGINLHIARTFGRHGARIFVSSRSAERVHAAVEELARDGTDAAGQAADVRDFAAVDAAVSECVKRFGALDIVIAGAAGNFVAPASSLSANGFRTVVDIDLNGTFNVARAAYERLRKPGGVLLAISATQGIAPTQGQAHVSAAKAGINALCQTLACEWGADGLRVNALAPGPVDGTEGMARLTPDEDSRQALEVRIPLGRYAHLDEIARAALFLCSNAASYITGTVLVCDGGQHLTARGAGLFASNFPDKAPLP